MQCPSKQHSHSRSPGNYGSIYRFIHRLEMTEPYLVIDGWMRHGWINLIARRSTLLVFNVKVATFLRPSLSVRGNYERFASAIFAV